MESSSSAKRMRVESPQKAGRAGAPAPFHISDDLNLLLSRPSPYGHETGPLANGEFAPSATLKEEVAAKLVLVIGAGAFYYRAIMKT